MGLFLHDVLSGFGFGLGFCLATVLSQTLPKLWAQWYPPDHE
jgi:hypothetical protein